MSKLECLLKRMDRWMDGQAENNNAPQTFVLSLIRDNI